LGRAIPRGLGAPEPNLVHIPTEVLGRLAPRQAEWCVENFQHNNVFDAAKARRDLDYRYTIRFEEGVRRCLDHLTRHNRIEDCAGYPFYDRIVEAWRRHTDALVAEFQSNPV